MRYLSIMLPLFLLLAAPVATAPAAHAAPTLAAHDVPLVIVRFNQARVYYQKQMYRAISQAVKIKPSVMFEIISYIPKTGKTNLDAKLKQQSLQQQQKLLMSLRKMGIPKSRISVANQIDPTIRHHEVHLYAR